MMIIIIVNILTTITIANNGVNIVVMFVSVLLWFISLVVFFLYVYYHCMKNTFLPGRMIPHEPDSGYFVVALCICIWSTVSSKAPELVYGESKNLDTTRFPATFFFEHVTTNLELSWKWCFKGSSDLLRCLGWNPPLPGDSVSVGLYEDRERRRESQRSIDRLDT